MTKKFKCMDNAFFDLLTDSINNVEGLIVGIDEIETPDVDMDKFLEKDIIATCSGSFKNGILTLDENFSFKKDKLNYKYVYFLWRIEGKSINQYIFPVQDSKYVEVDDDIIVKQDIE